eukprot:Gb_22020 [translate_table: standard]
MARCTKYAGSNNDENGRIEKQAPEGCNTKAWKKHIHWAGFQATTEGTKFVNDVECDLQASQPVRRHHGNLLDEGDNGFLVKKLVIESNKEDRRQNTEDKWALVYLASTPEQAASMGLNLPSVDEVKEEDDVKKACKIHRCLKWRRNKCHKKKLDNDDIHHEMVGSASQNGSSNLEPLFGVTDGDHIKKAVKRPYEIQDYEYGGKRIRIAIIDSDDEIDEQNVGQDFHYNQMNMEQVHVRKAKSFNAQLVAGYRTYLMCINIHCFRIRLQVVWARWQCDMM